MRLPWKTANATVENELFYNVSSTATTVPAGFTNDPNNKMASKLNGNINTGGNKRVGPSGLDTLAPFTVVGYRPTPPTPTPDVASSVGAAPATIQIAASGVPVAAAVAAVVVTTEVGGGTVVVTGLSSLPAFFGLVIGWAAYTVANTPGALPVINIPGDIGIGVPSHRIITDKVKALSHVKANPPPYPFDPTKQPAPGWTWHGRPGSIPGSKQGSWVNDKTKESLWNNSDHDEPIGEHYDYTDENGVRYRYFPDGRLEPK